ncbi:hypothetical protein bcgnr5378_05190 [Bacillus cereus]
MSYCSICKKDTEGRPFSSPTVVFFSKEEVEQKWVESSLKGISCIECKHVKSLIHNFDPEFPITYK